MNNEIVKELDRAESYLLKGLEAIKVARELYATESAKPTAKEGVYNAIKELGSADVKKIADRLGKDTKTIDNLCRSLVKDKLIVGVKEVRKIVYSIK